MDGDLDGSGIEMLFWYCVINQGYVTDNSDCNDVLANPGATEIFVQTRWTMIVMVSSMTTVSWWIMMVMALILLLIVMRLLTIYPGAIGDDNNPTTEGETIQPDCTCG
ncbi:MAG UNVERIFIED_CONTAM: hypothetical protein LVR18_42530 [Planctomycetaceae bacterium]|jgi:hypothetical protein